MAAPTAVVFDLDDTLYAERDFVLSGYRAVAAAFAARLGRSSDNLVRRMQVLFDTPDRGRVFNVIVEEASIAAADAVVAEMIATYRGHRPAIRLHADADVMLTRLRGAGRRLGLISDGPLQMQSNKVEALGLDHRIDEIILTDQWGREFWKPHPRAFEEMARRLAVAPEACLYVADNAAKDFVAPNALGWQTVHICRPDGVYAERPPAAGGAAQCTISGLDQLPVD